MKNVGSNLNKPSIIDYRKPPHHPHSSYSNAFLPDTQVRHPNMMPIISSQVITPMLIKLWNLMKPNVDIQGGAFKTAQSGDRPKNSAISFFSEASNNI